MIKTVEIKALQRTYDVLIGENLCENLKEHLAPLSKSGRIYILIDERLIPIYEEKIRASFGDGSGLFILPVPPGERSKSKDGLFAIYEQMLSFGITRSDLVAAFGGGTIGDLCGFAAATFLRGIPLVQIPTTLLAQVDSSIGGKVGINLPDGKNLVGTFYQPLRIISDISFLSSLPPREISSGMAEIIKMALLFDPAFFEAVALKKASLTEMVFRSAELNRPIIEEDEFDLGVRNLINYGHTFGHAIERAGNFSKYSHGEAVGIGMLFAMRFAKHLGVAKSDLSETLLPVLKAYGLPVTLRLNADATDVIFDALMHDKKRKGEAVSFVFLKEIGLPERVLVPFDTIREFLKEEMPKWI